MPLQEKKIKEVFNLTLYIAVGISLFALFLIEPLRTVLLSPIENFVKAYLEVFLNLLYAVFFVCSMSLIILASLVHRDYQRMKSAEESFKSQLIVKNYYEKSKA